MAKLKLMPLLSILVLLTVVNAIETAAQTSELKLQSAQNGFTGEYTSGNTKLFVEYQAPTTDSSVSRIQNSDRQTLAETIRDKDTVTVKITDVTIAYYIGKGNLDNVRSPELSEAETQKLEAFSLSEQSAHIRKLIVELIKQKASADSVQLKGFVVIAMFLGDGPGAPEELQSKTNCNSPKLVQMYASYRPQNQLYRKVKHSNVANKTNTAVDQCHGCCGPGCWGCTGCYTSACAAHDTCVAERGYFHDYCMYLL